MKCPQCYHVNAPDATECAKCAVIFRDLKRSKSASRDTSSDQCVWDDHGRRCPCKGIISTTTNGGGQWYCREHWDRLSGIEPVVLGNALPPAYKHPNETMIDFLKRREAARADNPDSV